MSGFEEVHVKITTEMLRLPIVSLIFTKRYLSVFIVYLLRLCSGQNERFLAEPQDATVVKGHVHLLSCSVENQVGQVQWLRDGFGLGLGTTFEGFPRYKIRQDQNPGEHRLMVTNIQLEDDAIFQCQVGATENTPGLRSRKAKLTVLLPPDSVKIEGSPVVEVYANAVHNLTCNAHDAKPAPAIEWLSNSAPLTDDVGIERVYSVTNGSDGKRENATSVLAIRPQKSDQGRSYECYAKNQAMVELMRARIYVEVIYPPEVTIALMPSEYIREHRSLMISCSAMSNPAVYSWRWFSGPDIIVDQSSSVVLIHDLNRQMHGKNITCEATNKAGSSQKSVTLGVSYGPEFRPAMADYAAADPGDSVSLICDVDSNPPPEVVWTKKGSTLTLTTDRTLVLSKVTDEMFGFYTCVASLLGFKEILQDVQLIKKGPPTILSSGEQSARYGDVGVIECFIRAVPKPTKIIWYKDKKLLYPDDVRSRYKVRQEDIKDGRHSILEIASTQDEDFGVYNCSTSNGYGHAHIAITFSRKAGLPLTYTLAAVISGIIFIIVVVSLAVFLYHRRKSLGSEKNSDGSECSITKKKDAMPDMKIEYSNGAAAPLVATPPHRNHRDYPSAVATWNTDGIDGRRNGHTPTQFVMRHDPWSQPRYPAYPAAYHQHHHHGHPYIANNLTTADIYATYPRRPRNPIVRGDSNAYGSDMYGTLRGGVAVTVGPRHPGSYVQHPPPPPPVSPASSRLSTNV